MVNITFDQKQYSLQGGETVLECLLRHQVDYPHSCQSGTCQSCLSQCHSGALEQGWQKGLKPTLVSKHYFLPCLAKPGHDLSIGLPHDDAVSTEASMIETFHFNHDVLCVRLKVSEPAAWTPGQYVNLVNPEGLVRSYSIANLPRHDGFIELHVKLMPGGLMSQWLVERASVGLSVLLRGPIGECFYCNPNRASFPMVLAGTGTGLAPLLGIVLDALDQGHEGEIVLIHGGVKRRDLYADEKLTAMAAAYANFRYEKCTLEASDDCQAIAIGDLLVDTLKAVVRPRLYVCGPAETANKLKMKGFLAGVASADIYSDVFVSAS